MRWRVRSLRTLLGRSPWCEWALALLGLLGARIANSFLLASPPPSFDRISLIAHTIPYTRIPNPHSDRYKIDRSHIRARAELDPLDKLKLEKTLTYFHYQCLWWGGERIWSGELVRVLTDDELFPAGCLPRSPGAETRSLFLRVDTIYKDGESDQAKVAGRLYELRDLKGVTVVEGDGGGSAMSKFETTTTTTTTTTKHYGQANSNGGLSPSTSTSTSHSNAHPILLDHHLPPPPPGFEFRLLTPVDSHATFDAEYLAGRYYELPPALRKRETIDAVLLEIGEEQEVVDDQLTVEIRAMALAGLTRARVLYMAVSTELRKGERKSVTGLTNWREQAATWTTDRLTTVRNAEDTSQVRARDSCLLPPPPHSSWR